MGKGRTNWTPQSSSGADHAQEYGAICRQSSEGISETANTSHGKVQGYIHRLEGTEESRDSVETLERIARAFAIMIVEHIDREEDLK